MTVPRLLDGELLAGHHRLLGRAEPDLGHDCHSYLSSAVPVLVTG